MLWGIDTTTEEGRKAFRAEHDALCEMAPEILKKEDLVRSVQILKEAIKVYNSK